MEQILSNPSSQTLLHRALTDIAWLQDKKSGTFGALSVFFIIAFGVGLLTLSSHTKLNIGLVPITMQSLAIFFIAFTYGARLGYITVLAWLMASMAGAPVLANGAGLAYFTGPTAGYLISFPIAVYVVGWFSDKGASKSPLPLALIMILGNAIIYAGGLLWLGTFMGYNMALLNQGMLAFITGDLAKIAILAVTLPLIWKLKP